MNIDFKVRKSNSILKAIAGFTTLLILACSSAPKTNLPPKEAFVQHWKKIGGKVQVVQILAVENGIYRGNAIVDGHPVEDFYSPSTGEISKKAPANGYSGGPDEAKGPAEKKFLYKDLILELAKELSQNIPAESRIAVLKIPSDGGQETQFSTNFASKLEMGLIRSGRDVVDRGKIDQILNEQNFQQNESPLFSPSTSARLGKFVGANTVITGEYHASLPKAVTVTVKAISVETTRVIAVQEKEIPLSGAGSDNRDEVMELLGSGK